MLTRAGVAKRLGKSIATIRRMEGVELHPVRDEHGVYRFDPDEVDRVGSPPNGEPSNAARMDEFLRWQQDRREDSSPRQPATPLELNGLAEMRQLAEQMRRDAEIATRERQHAESLRAFEQRRRAEEDTDWEEFREQLEEFVGLLDGED